MNDKKQSINDRGKDKKLSKTSQQLLSISQGTSTVIGEKFFDNLAQCLAAAFDVRYAFIGKIIDFEKNLAQMSPLWDDVEKKFNNSIVWNLKNTPCDDVILKETRLIPNEVQKLYPLAPILKSFNIESYFGIPLISSSGKRLGVISVMDDKPMTDINNFESIIQIFADRCAGEIERLEIDSELKEASISKKRSDEYLSIIANNTTSVIYMKNLEGRYLFINKRWENIFNVTSQEVLGKTDLELFPKEIAEKFIKHDQQIMQSGETFEGEEFAPHDDGLHTYFSIKVPLKDSKGVIYGMCGVSTDITDKKISENLTARLGRILDNSFNEIYLFNAENYKFVTANLGAYKNLNYSHEEMQNLTPLDLKPEITKEIFEEMVRPLRSKEKSLVVFETLHKRKDGTTYPVEVRLQLMANETPQVFIAVSQDITQRKQAEEEIKNYCSKLEKANDELQSFSTITSHDLQEPLRKIIAFGDRLATRIPETDEQGKDYLNRMQKSALRMRNLVEDLLQYTEVENKPRPFETLNLNKVVETVLDDLETRIKETQGAVNIMDLPVIEGDAVQLHQLFLNIIGNALKFHRDGIPPVVNLESVKTENGFWEISVEDNGIGIEEEHVDKVFQPFERLHGRATYEGTGIGLTICNKIVSRHGGKITVKRNSTNGVTFHITLPEKQNR